MTKVRTFYILLTIGDGKEYKLDLMKVTISSILGLVPLALVAGATLLCAQHIRVTPHADGTQIPASIPYDGSPDDGRTFVGFAEWENNNIRGQVFNGRAYWIIPSLRAGQQQRWIAGRRAFLARARKDFEFRSYEDHVEVRRHSQPVLRFDTATKRLFIFDDPERRPRLRLHLGWGETSFRGKTFDTWLMTGATATVTEVKDKSAGPIMATLTPHLIWETAEGTIFLEEERRITAYAQPDGTMLDFDTTFTAPNGEVKLGGAPAQTGLHFRPSKAAKVRFQLPGENVDLGQASDLPWVALTCTVREREMHVQLMCHPTLPSEAKLYTNPKNGNMGSAPAATIKPGATLRLRYRLLLREGPAPMQEKLRLDYQNFITPPKVELVKP